MAHMIEASPSPPMIFHLITMSSFAAQTCIVEAGAADGEPYLKPAPDGILDQLGTPAG